MAFLLNAAKSLFGTTLKVVHYHWNVPKYTDKLEFDHKDFPQLSSSGVTIIRDKFGVAHVKGKTVCDVYFGQGFVTAQERLFQLEILRRVASGTLSELDEQCILVDRFCRTLGFTRAAKEDRKKLNQQEIDEFTAYVGGINYFLKSKHYGKPIEMKLSGLDDPRPATIEDILCTFRFTAWTMNFVGWYVKLINTALEELIPNKSDFESMRMCLEKEKNPACHYIGEKIDHKKLDKLKDSFDNAGGSNCVCIGGKLTKSGNPMLFSDPHLGVSNPSVWIRMSLEVEQPTKIHATGFTFLGAFGVHVFHNSHVSMGVTLAMCDVYECYKEKLDKPLDQATKYLSSGGKWKKLEQVEEKIIIKGQKKPHIEKVKITRNGPIISSVWGYETKTKEEDDEDDVDDETMRSENDHIEISLKSTMLAEDFPGMDCGDNYFRVVACLWRAKTFEEVKKVAQSCPMFNLNMCVSEAPSKDNPTGTIGYAMSGAIPVRTPESIKEANKCLPGWLDEYQWQGYIKGTEGPWCKDPDCGYIISCNQRCVAKDEYPHHLGNIFLKAHRANRIREMIQGWISKNEKIDYQHGMAIHNDITMEKDSFISNLMKYFLTHFKDEKELPLINSQKNISKELVLSIAKEIRDWDFVCSVNSTACTLYHIFELMCISVLMEDGCLSAPSEGLMRGILGAGIDKEFHPCTEYWDKGGYVLEGLITDENEKKKDSLLYRAGGKMQVILKSIFRTIEKLRKWSATPKGIKSVKKELEGWRYGNFHLLSFKHKLSDFVVGYDIECGGVGGSSRTPNAMAFMADCNDEDRMHIDDIPSCRFIIDMGEPEKAICIFPPGNSSNPCSKFYNNNIEKYVKGEYNPMIYTAEDLEKNKEGVLEIIPKKVEEKDGKKKKKKKKEEKKEEEEEEEEVDIKEID